MNWDAFWGAFIGGCLPLLILWSTTEKPKKKEGKVDGED